MKNMKCALLSVSLIAVIGVVACGPEPVSVEEKVLMESLSGLSAAQAYDHVCQEGSLRKIPPTDPKFVNLMGNTQMLAYRISGFMRDRRPDDTMDQAAARLQDTQKLFAAKAEAAIKNDGCDSAAGKAGANSFRLYTGSQPGVVHQLIDNEVIKRGGKPVMQKVKAEEPEPADAAPRSMTVEEIQNAPPQGGSAAGAPTFDQKVKSDFLAPHMKSDESAE